MPCIQEVHNIFLLNYCLHRLCPCTSLLCIQNFSGKHHVLHSRMSSYPLLLQATINTSEKIILLLFISTKEFLQSHFPLRQLDTVSINPLAFLINFLFMPWLFSLELLHLWIMDKVRTITVFLHSKEKAG